jgi:Transposase, Mutator family
MPRGKLRPTLAEVKALLAQDRDFVRPLVQTVLQELLEAEMTEVLGAEKGERPPARPGYRAGYDASAACPASSLWSPTTMPAVARRSSRSGRRRPGHAVTCTSAGTLWTTCRARSTMTACPRAGCGRPGGPPRPRGGQARARGLARQTAGDLSQALRRDRGAHRGDAHLLSAAAPAPQAPQVDQSARTPERRDQAADPPRPHLPERRELPTADPGARGRNARELARGASLPQHGRPARAQQGGAADRGVMLIHLPCGPPCALPTRAHHRHHDPSCRRFRTQLRAGGRRWW